jgi:hypothetical protein
MNLAKRMKRDPWRNTRNDKSIPWRDVFAAIFMVLIPIIIVSLSSNFVLRSGTFYSFYMSKTGVISEIPYYVENEDIVKTFGNYMIHKTDEFTLKEHSEYKPQQVFNQRDGQVVEYIRSTLDKILVVAIIFSITAIAIFVFLYRNKEKKLLYESFMHSLIWFAVLLAMNGVLYFVKPVREIIFKTLFGVRFPPGDVLIILFENKLAMYMGIWQIGAALLLMVVLAYFMKISVSDRKMFRGM